MMEFEPPLRLRLDGAALTHNWFQLDRMSGQAAAGAAVKANAYGLGAVEVTRRLLDAGCRDFFVAHWSEAAELTPFLPDDAHLSVLNGIASQDMAGALTLRAKPVISSVTQAKLWRATGRPCDLMINSGMNRLGVDPDELSAIAALSLEIDIAMSHLASADEDTPQNAKQLAMFRDALPTVKYRRSSLANSAGIALGADFHRDLSRPGLGLYGGRPTSAFTGIVKQVVYPEARILQRRQIAAGEHVGYNATFTASHDMALAIVAIGYADGYFRGFSSGGCFWSGEQALPVVGRVSMDLTAVDISNAVHLSEGDWISCDFDLPSAAQISGMSQYELLTGLGQRYTRDWR
jgi:alanine racemase